MFRRGKNGLGRMPPELPIDFPRSWSQSYYSVLSSAQLDQWHWFCLAFLGSGTRSWLQRCAKMWCLFLCFFYWARPGRKKWRNEEFFVFLRTARSKPRHYDIGSSRRKVSDRFLQCSKPKKRGGKRNAFRPCVEEAVPTYYVQYLTTPGSPPSKRSPSPEFAPLNEVGNRETDEQLWKKGRMQATYIALFCQVFI